MSLKPIHILLLAILLFLLIKGKLEEQSGAFFAIVLLYTLFAYLDIAKQKGISLTEAIKEDLPEFNLFHLILFLIISAPLLYIFYVIIFEI